MTNDEQETESELEGYIPAAEVLARFNFTPPQLRNLVSAGVVRTERVKRGVTVYCVDDLQRLEGGPRVGQPDDEPSSVVLELRAISAGYKDMLELALKQTKQAQDHERMLITAFTKPLENLGSSSQQLVTAVLEQNKGLVQRATDGDTARLDFVKAAETMLKDQRVELREQLEQDRKHELRREMWDGVKKAAPYLLEGWRKTTGADALEAASKLKEKLSPDKVAALVAFKLLDSEELDLLCTAFGYDRADLERRAAEASEVKESTDEPAPAEPEAAE